jgi:hypothetical protein
MNPDPPTAVPIVIRGANPAPHKLAPAAGSPRQPRGADAINNYAEPGPLRLAVRGTAPPGPSAVRPPATKAPRFAGSPLVAPALHAAFEWVVQPSAKARTDVLPIESREHSPVAPRSATPDTPVIPNISATLSPPARLPGPEVAARGSQPADHPREIHIGSIEVRIEAPPPKVTPFPPQTPARTASSAPLASGRGLARGFTTPLGLRQG